MPTREEILEALNAAEGAVKEVSVPPSLAPNPNYAPSLGPGEPAPPLPAFRPRAQDERPAGGPLLGQVGLSIAPTNARKQSYLESLYGPESVSHVPGVGFFFLNPASGKWERYDDSLLARNAFDIGATAALALGAGASGAALGPAAAVSGSLPTRAITSGAIGAGLQSVKENLARNYLPGEPEPGLAGSAARTAVAGAGAGVGQLVGDVALKVVPPAVTAIGRGLDETGAAYILAAKAVAAERETPATGWLRRGFDAVKAAAGTPAALGSRFLARKALGTPQAALGADLLESAGLSEAASLGQITQAPSITALEHYTRLFPFSAQTAMKADAAARDAAYKRVTSLIDSYDPTAKSRIDVGGRLKDAYESSMEKLLAVRASNAARAFAAAESAAGGTPIVKPAATVSAIDDLISAHSVPGETSIVRDLIRLRAEWSGLSPSAADDVANVVIGGSSAPLTGDAAARVRAAIQKAKGLDTNALSTDPTSEAFGLSASQLKHLLSTYGGRGGSGGSYLSGIGDRAVRRGIAARVFGALQEDLDSAASTGGVQGTAAELLKAARDLYREDSALINTATRSLFGKAFKSAGAGKDVLLTSPEVFVDKYLSLEPSQKRLANLFLQQADPTIMQPIRAHTLTRALNAAMGTSEGELTGATTQAMFPPSRLEIRFDVKKFYEALPRGDDYSALFGPLPERGSLDKIVRSFGRLANEGSVNYGANQGGAFFAVTVAARRGLGAAGRALSGDLVGSSAEVATLLSPQTVAWAMLTPEGRKALDVVFTGATRASRHVVQPSAEFGRAVVYLSALQSRLDTKDKGSAPTP